MCLVRRRGKGALPFDRGLDSSRPLGTQTPLKLYHTGGEAGVDAESYCRTFSDFLTSNLTFFKNYDTMGTVFGKGAEFNENTGIIPR